MNKSKIDDVRKYWHPTKNANILIDDCKSRTICWWICEKNQNHIWDACFGDQCRNFNSIHHGCPYCAGKRILTEDSLKNKNPEVASQWHPKLNNFSPTEVLCQSNKFAWWVCGKNKNHIWKAKIYTRTKKHPAGCPFCAGKKPHVDNCLEKTHPHLTKEWHPTLNSIKPTEITFGSHKKIWWQCRMAEDHVWLSSPNTRNTSVGCPFCCNVKVCKSNCLYATHPELTKEWDFQKNILTPNDVVWGCHKKIWWSCKCGNSWKASVKSRSYGKGCIRCKSKSKGEILIKDFLISHNMSFISQYRFESCKNQKPLPFDFAIEICNSNLEYPRNLRLIEYQGIHHYKPVDIWGGLNYFEQIKKHDLIKKEFCKKNNLPFLAIPYWEKNKISQMLSCFLETDP